MTSLKPLPWSPAGQPGYAWSRPVRRIAAATLQSASFALARLAAQLAWPVAAVQSPPPMIEFHAEAGAPEGALYADGELVGWLPGVTRL